MVSYHITGNNSTDCKEQVGKYFEMCIEEVSEGNHPQLRRSLEESPFLRLQGTKDRVALLQIRATIYREFILANLIMIINEIVPVYLLIVLYHH